MSNTLYEKTGIRLTRAQSELFTDTVRAVIVVIVLGILAFAVSVIFNIANPDCLAGIIRHTDDLSQATTCVNANNELSGVFSAIFALAFWLPFLPLFIHAVAYFVKLLKPEFRESEMAESVNYLEGDEREQLITMRATRRAYMVLNFTLLAAWIFSLFNGNFGTAFTLFIVQAIGAISYKRQIEK